MKLATEALGKPSLNQADRREVARKISALADLLAEVATIGELPFDSARAAQIREKVKEITELANMLIEKGEAL
ncbi:MAG: hypothetical protein WCE23_06495 [Candidatus Binatus sp.]|uniref:hypothetical protein n=1 Tax=Candidatus Binatus sp. TaxID=2811406 RepID=UPI003C751BBA